MTVRVLLYSRVNPADEGGVQTVFRRLSAHLQHRGHAVVKAWSVPPPQGAPDDRAVELPLLGTTGGLPPPRAMLGAARALLRLGAQLSRWRPQVVNLHFVTGDALYFLLLKPIFRYKVVLSAHGSDVLRPKPWNAPLLPRILPKADAITAVSLLTAARILEFPGVDPARVWVIPNGVPYDFWSAPSATPDLVQRSPLVLTVGRLHPVKGHDVLLHAFRRVRARLPEARLIVVGDGGHRAALEQLRAELGLEACVEFTGQLGANAVRDLLGRTRVFVLPSRSEGLPLALIEAMAAGVPVVATRVGGVPDVMAPGTGVLVPPENPEALAGALEEVLVNAQVAMEMSRRARVRARDFSSLDTDARYEQLLHRLAGANGPQQRT